MTAAWCLQRFVADLLDVSVLISGNLKLHRQRVDLGLIISRGLEALRPAAVANGIQMKHTPASEGRMVDGDPQRLQQIVSNLVGNAIKFTPAGGCIDVALRDAADCRLRLVVRDDGVGIDPDFLPHVFDRFRQPDDSTSRTHGGLGLGLAIVNHLVELHGGRAHAESPGRGKGSTSIIDLPRAAPAAQDVRSAQDAAPA